MTVTTDTSNRRRHVAIARSCSGKIDATPFFAVAPLPGKRPDEQAQRHYVSIERLDRSAAERSHTCHNSERHDGSKGGKTTLICCLR
jgi:hypothetical protein